MRIIVTGASGLIGREVIKSLSGNGFEVIALSRNPGTLHKQMSSYGATFSEWPAAESPLWNYWFSESCAVLNLAGESIASGRWTKKRKQRITESRIHTATLLVEAIRHAESKPEVLIQASATGYYGNRKGEELNEESVNGSGFLASLVIAWEEAALKAEAFGVRVCLLRTGLVLSKDGGALPKLAIPVRLFAGAWPGNGRQFVSWIHIKDVIRIVRFIADTSDLIGPVNLTAPNPVTMRDFVKAIGKAYKRPVLMGIPSILLKIALGKMAKETLLCDQIVLPGKLMKRDFEFVFPDINDAMRDLGGRE